MRSVLLALLLASSGLAEPVRAAPRPDRASPSEAPPMWHAGDPPSRALPWELPDGRLLPALPDLAASESRADGADTIEAAATVAVLDMQVDFADGGPIGRVVDVLVDRGGRPLGVVLDCGGFLGVGNRKVAVAWAALRFPSGEGDIGSALDPDAVRDAPEYLEGHPVALLAGAPPEAHPAPPSVPAAAPASIPAPR